jgi:hypothetical protein
VEVSKGIGEEVHDTYSYDTPTDKIFCILFVNPGIVINDYQQRFARELTARDDI